MASRNNCPACGVTEIRYSFCVSGYEIWCCRKCGSLFVHNLPSNDDLACIYKAETYYELSPESIKRIESENTRRIINIHSLSLKGKLLDIGCAKGLLLDEAAKYGFVTFGIELSSNNAEIASSKGHKTFLGDLKSFLGESREGQFNVVTCLDVIEHIDDPLEFLQMAKSLLAPNGLLVLSTPNYSGIVARVLKQHDPFMTPPEHINFFTAHGLFALATKVDLSVKRKENFGKLTNEEMERSVRRYVPSIFSCAYPLIKTIASKTFILANKLNLGLEQELYLVKKHDR